MKATKPAALRMRGDWGEIKPVTRVIPNKRRETRPKHKGRQFDE